MKKIIFCLFALFMALTVLMLYADDSYSANVYMEQGGDRLVVKNGGEISYLDGGQISLGTGDDVTLEFDGTNLELFAAAADTPFAIGGTSYGFDMTYYFETTGTIALDYDGDDMTFSDNMALNIGTGSDWSIWHNGTTTTATGALTHAGDIIVSGTTPLVTIGDAGAEDAQLNFDGNAQDFHIGLDDTDDDLVIGLGTALGTTDAISIDENLNVTVEVSLKHPIEVVTATNVITANEGGKTFILNSATEFASTLPTASTAAGMTLRFIVRAAPSGASYTISTGNTHENVIYGVVTEAETDTGDDGPTAQAQDTITFVDGVAVIGDWVELTCDGTNWYVRGMTAADGGVTFSTT